MGRCNSRWCQQPQHTHRIVRVYVETHMHVHMQTNTLLCTCKCFLHTTCSRRSFICLEGCSCHWICWYTRTLWHCSTDAENHKCWLHLFTAAFHHLRCTTQKAHTSRSRSGLIFIFRHLQSWSLCPFPDYPYVNLSLNFRWWNRFALWFFTLRSETHPREVSLEHAQVKLSYPKKYDETFSDQYFVIKKRPPLLKTCRRN